LPKTGRHAWENTTSQPNTNMPAPSEPTVVQDYVVSMAKRGRTSSEIARRLRIPQDQVDLILKLRRNG
jgi:DNA-binding CsgD family transcriptional regulator